MTARARAQEGGRLADSLPKRHTEPLPVVHFLPTMNEHMRDDGHYECPLYKTAARAGALSTTGQSTNFVVAVHLPTHEPPDHWVRMGTALLCESVE